MATTTPAPESKKSIWPAVLSFVIGHWQYLLIIATAITGGIFASHYLQTRQEINDLHKVQAWTDSISNSKISYYVDALGKEHARAENLAIHDAAMSQYADSVAKALKVKSDQVTSITKVSGKASYDITPVIDHADSVKVPCKGDSVYITKTFDFHWNDPWTKLSGRVGIGAVNNINLTLEDTLTITDYWKRNWFLGPKHYYTDLTNSNPHVHVSGYKGVKLASEAEAEKQWSIGPTFGVGYYPGAAISKPAFFVGLSVQYLPWCKKF